MISFNEKGSINEKIKTHLNKERKV